MSGSEGPFGTFEFVVASSQILNAPMTLDHDRRCPVILQPSDRSQPRFQSAVVTFDSVISVLFGVAERVWDLFFDEGFQRLGQISHHPDWFTVGGQGFGERPSGGWDIAPLRHENINDLAILVNGQAACGRRRNATFRRLSRRFRRRTSGHQPRGDKAWQHLPIAE